MRKALKVTAWLLLALVVAILVKVSFHTRRGNTSWYIKVRNATVTIDGKPAEGRLYKKHSTRAVPRIGKLMLLVLKGGGKAESFMMLELVGFPDAISRCKGWDVPRLPAFPVAHMNEPCHRNLAGEAPEQIRDVQIGPNYFEFTEKDGKRVRAEW